MYDMCIFKNIKIFHFISFTFIESVMLDSDLTCAYRVLACGGA